MGVMAVTRSTRSLRELAQGRLRSTRSLRELAQGRLGGIPNGHGCGDVEDPEQTVVEEEGVLVEVVEGDEDEDGERPRDTVDFSALPERPKLQPSA